MIKTSDETNPTSSDTLPPALRELISIFSKELAEVNFPGVDAKVLTDLANDVAAETQRVEELRAQLDTAHATLIEVKQRLQKSAEQGLAYAKVYAATDADLATRLAEVNLGGETPRRRKLEVAAPAAGAAEGGEGAEVKQPAKRGRKPKQPPQQAAEGGEEETGS